MKTAVVYYSMCGNTAYAADKIAKETGADIIELKPVKAYHDKGFKKFFFGGKSAVMGEKPALEPYKFNADDYDDIIIGFPVWASRIAPPVRTFIEENKDKLSEKNISAYACPSGAGAEKAFKKLKDILGIADYKSLMILTDPKDKPSDDNERNIKEFCGSLR